MGIIDKLKTQLIEIIEWLDNTNDTMVYRFPGVYENAIKNGAQLIVREGQSAVFVNEGKIADVFTPGHYSLTTQNMPILTVLGGWKYGFESPFKAEVYFVNTKQFTDLKWGTANPIMLRDPEFGPIRLRAFGTYSIHVVDPAVMIRQIVGTDGRFQVEEIQGQLKSTLVSHFSTILGASHIAALDLASNYDQLSIMMKPKLNEDFGTMGLELSKFFVENISFPPEVEAALDKRSQMGILGDLGRYTQFQTANAIEEAAKNPGGSAGAGLGLGAGFAMGNAMANSFGQGMSGQQSHGGPSAATVSCPKCSMSMPEGSKFCSNCGTTVAPATVPCVKCASPLRPGARFCNECGSPQDVKATCPNCHAELHAGAKFCNECGTKTA
jgi:membrane protease subunit (stomatin/prohibitin family)